LFFPSLSLSLSLPPKSYLVPLTTHYRCQLRPLCLCRTRPAARHLDLLKALGCRRSFGATGLAVSAMFFLLLLIFLLCAGLCDELLKHSFGKLIFWVSLGLVMRIAMSV